MRTLEEIVDQTVDTNYQELYRLVSIYGAPEVVKEASAAVVGSQGADSLPVHLFADPGKRRFPVNTGPAAYVSMMYFLPQEAGYGKSAEAVRSRIENTAAYFGMGGEIRALEARFKAAASRPADADLPDEAFALPGRRLGMADSSGVVKAAAYIREYAPSWTMATRREAAGRVLARDHQVGGLSLEDQVWLEKQAGHGYGDRKAAAKAFYERASVLKSLGQLDDALVMAEKAASILGNPSAYIPSHRADLMDMLDDTDRKHRLRGLTPPEDLTGITYKQASSCLSDHVGLTSGSVYPKSGLSRLDLGDLRDTFGADFADRVSAGGLILDTDKMAAFLPTLPRGDANIFDRLAEASGVTPVHSEPKAVRFLG